MTDEALKKTLLHMAEPVVTSLGLAVWGVEIARAGRTIVRLFVDVPFSSSPDGNLPSGSSAETAAAPEDVTPPAPKVCSATLEQCEEISRTLGLALEVEDSISDAYVLEVSTPGLTRLFFSLDQMRRYLGDVIEARLLSPAGTEEVPAGTPDPGRAASRRVWRGILLEVGAEAFALDPVSVTPEGEVIAENLPPVRIPWNLVRRASRMYIFKQPQKPGKGSSKLSKDAPKSAARSKGGKAAAAKKPTTDGSETN